MAWCCATLCACTIPLQLKFNVYNNIHDLFIALLVAVLYDDESCRNGNQNHDWSLLLVIVMNACTPQLVGCSKSLTTGASEKVPLVLSLQLSTGWKCAPRSYIYSLYCPCSLFIIDQKKRKAAQLCSLIGCHPLASLLLVLYIHTHPSRNHSSCRWRKIGHNHKEATLSRPLSLMYIWASNLSGLYYTTMQILGMRDVRKSTNSYFPHELHLLILERPTLST